VKRFAKKLQKIILLFTEPQNKNENKKRKRKRKSKKVRDK